jgi:hypothetical protein
MIQLGKVEECKEENIARDRVISIIIESFVQAFTNAVDISVRPEIAEYIKSNVMKLLKISLPVERIFDCT